MMLQQQAEEIGRAMKLAPDSVGISSQLPAPIPLQLLGWNAAGNGVANFSPDAFVTATTAGVAHQYPVTAGQTTIGVHGIVRSEEHTSELQSLMRTPYAFFCLEEQRINIRN